MLGKLKALALAMLKEVSARVRRRRSRSEQEVLAHIADVVIECYAVESALARSEKLQARAATRPRLRRSTSPGSTPATPPTVRPTLPGRSRARSKASGRRPAFADLLAAVSAYAGVDTVACQAPDRRCRGRGWSASVLIAPVVGSSVNSGEIVATTTAVRFGRFKFLNRRCWHRGSAVTFRIDSSRNRRYFRLIFIFSLSASSTNRPFALLSALRSSNRIPRLVPSSSSRRRFW